MDTVVINYTDNLNITNVIDIFDLNGKKHINMYGSIKEPLFKATDICELLEINEEKNILKEIDKDDKILIPISNNIDNNLYEYFITEYGLYEILFISKTPLIKEYKLYIKNLLKNNNFLKSKWRVNK